VALGVALAALAGCKSKEAAPGGAPAAGASAGAAPAPVKAETLEPLIHPLGPEGAVPTRVVFEFSRPLVAEGELNQPLGEETRLSVTPEARGSLRFTGPSTLTFTPSAPLAFDTAYTVRLEQVRTPTGPVQAPAGGWTASFRTPAFGFVRHALESVNPQAGQAVVALHFSGPVDLASLRRQAVWQLDGTPLREVKLGTTGEPSAVRAVLSDARVAGGRTVRLLLKSGTASSVRGADKAPQADVSFKLPEGKRLSIGAAHLREGATGFFVEVACRDVEPGARDVATDEGESDGDGEGEGDYYWGGRGCEVDDAAALEAVRFEPAVKFSVAPGRSGFRLFGDFKRGSYTLKVAAGLASQGGGTLHGAYARTFTVPARKPQLSFGASGRYLPRSAWRNLAVSHLNLDQAELVVRQVPPENLVFWMGDAESEAAGERVANVIHRRTLHFPSGAPDTLATTHVDVASALPASTRGVLELTLQSGAVKAVSRLLLTDMSLVAKRTPPSASAGVKEGVWVWALGIDSTEPLSGVEVSLVKRSGQAVARCTTGGADGCTLEVPQDAVDPAQPFALVARKGEDLTYLRYEDLKTEIAESDVQGEPFRSERPYRASIYLDRGVYRPGDTAHVAAVLRGQDGAAPPAGLPVELKVVDPRERVTRRQVLKTNEAGLLALDVPFEAFAETGVYAVQLAVADRQVAARSLNVEEFVPERMKVQVAAERAGYALGEEVPVDVQAAYLFGGSAADSPVEVACRLEAAAFRPRENAQLTYGVWRAGGQEPKPVTLGQVKAELDAQGQARLRCPALTSAGGFKGAARLVAQAAVFEAGSGRSTQGVLSVPVHPERYYVGLQSGARKVSRGKPFTVSGAVVDWDGKALPDAVKSVEVEYARLETEYGYFWDESEGGERYQRFLRPVREGKATVPVAGGRFELSVTPQAASASYLVRVRSGGAQSDLVLEGEWTGWYWGEQREVDQTPRPARATTLPLELPPLARVGEKVQVKLKAPYRGRVLLTAETDRVLAAEWREVEAGEQTWSFPLEGFSPNVYVSAFLVKDPHLESKEAFLPDRAFGVGSVTVEPTAFTQGLKLEAPKEVRSNDTLTVTLDLGPLEGPTFATVAAVDEGILQLTRFASPDPLSELFTKRALGVETYETVGWTLLVPPQGNSRSTGGDGDGGAAGRVQPVKPVALWSGVVPVPQSGKVTVSFQVPQYRGQLRVMAVTTGPKRVGRASAQVLVRDPITLSTTLPRFLSQHDTVQVPVFVTNLSGKALDVKVRLEAEALPVPGMSAAAVKEVPLELLGKREGGARLEDGKSATLVFQARAAQAVGAARLTVVASGGGFTSRESLDVPFSPAGPRERLVQRVELAEGTTDLKPLLAGWTPTTERSTVWVTSNPYGESFEHLRYLVQYPYGCIEQTTSSTRPMLFVSGLLDSVDPTLLGDKKAEEYVMAGVRRVLSMQTPAGGFSYWPGATEPVAWGTAYASHMLLDAQKAGYAVPQDRLDEALAWAGGALDAYEANTARREGHYEDHDGDAEPYLHYVLSLAGKGRKAAALKALERIPKDTRDGQKLEHAYMLKAALYLAGDRRYERDLKSPDVSPVSGERRNTWSFYSDRRRRGFMLSTFEDLFPGQAAGEPLAQLVAGALSGQGSGDYTTQELVWGVTGLGKRVGSAAGGFSPPVLTAGGKRVAAPPNPKVKSSERTWALARASEYPSLELQLEKKGEGKVFAILSSQGVRQNGSYRLGGQGLSVTRRYRTLDGAEVDVRDGAVPLAQMLFVELEVKNTTGERVQNLALVDRLPAGWEIENPRLGRGVPVEWVDRETLWQADAMNVRDDRLELFGALEKGEARKVVYAVRAVTAGTFTLPPVEVEAMYDPRVWAREAGGQVEVSGPWKDFLL
jgi:uncharacterized protein YfaS (alpha-2-macroglobulin family)